MTSGASVGGVGGVGGVIYKGAGIARLTGAPTKPAAGVIATRPAIAPVQKPTTDHFRSSRKSMINQVIPLRRISGGPDTPHMPHRGRGAMAMTGGLY